MSRLLGLLDNNTNIYDDSFLTIPSLQNSRAVAVPECGGVLFRQIFLSRNGAAIYSLLFNTGRTLILQCTGKSAQAMALSIMMTYLNVKCVRKIIEIVATRCEIFRQNAQIPTGDLIALPIPSSWIKGLLRERRSREEWWEVKGWEG